MLLIHEFRLDGDLESGGVGVGALSALGRPSMLGRLVIGFAGVVTDAGGGGGGFSVRGALEVSGGGV